jgi:hypothetical protein
MNKHSIATSTSTALELHIHRGRASTADEGVTVFEKGKPRNAPPKAVVNAVYGHIQAVRALGRETITTVEIARALLIPLSDVTAALERLKKKGVKPAGK